MADLINWARHELGVGDLKERFPTKATCLTIYSRVVNAQGDLKVTLGKWFPWVAAHEDALRGLFASYVEMKQRQNVLDYDDLLLYFAQMLAEPAIAAEIAGRFDHLLVDEYQDTNALQGAIVLRLRPLGRGLTVVGDDAQAIYSFRAATVRNILDFPAAFDPPAHVVTLERNYRSSGAILAAANATMALAPERFAKTLRTDRPHGPLPALVTVADDSTRRASLRPECSPIARRARRSRRRRCCFAPPTTAPRSNSNSLAATCRSSNRRPEVPRRRACQGRRRAHALCRKSTRSRRGLSRRAAHARRRAKGCRDHCRRGGGRRRLRDDVGAIDASESAERLSRLRRPHAKNASRSAPWPAEIADAVAWLGPLMETRYDDARIRMGDLEALERIAASFPSRERFLSELALDPPDATSDEAGPPLRDEDFLILSTIHSAKGQEWRSVFVLNCVDGCIPSDLATGSSEEIEEERRLLYVAMTRAKDELALVVPQRFYVHGQPRNGDRSVYASRTRFIPPPLLKHFDRQTWPEAVSAPQHRPSDGPRVDLQARMRAMWR